MKTLRIETINQPNAGNRDNSIANRLIVFDNEHGELEGHDIPNTSFPFNAPVEELKLQIQQVLDQKGTHVNIPHYRIIHNEPIPNAYSAPFKVFLDITLRCQLACRFCLAGSSPAKSKDLSMEICEQIIEEMGKVGVFMTKLGGGEPLLHPNFWQIVHLLQQQHIFTSISTNGVGITQDIAQKLKENRIKVSLSIDGMREIHDTLRGEGSFDKAIQSLHFLKKVGIENLSIRVNVLPSNFKDVPAIVQLAKALEVKAKFCFCKPAGRSRTDTTNLIHYHHAPEYFQILQFLNRADILPYVSLDEAMMFVQPESLRSITYGSKICGAANRSMHIDPNGIASPCIFMGPDYSNEKVTFKNGILSIWRGTKNDPFDRMRNLLEPTECKSCSRLCHFECPSMRSFFNKGDTTGPDPLCLKGILTKIK
jgi:radical SAM protein with 4Fe4S-binding SPASM domain